VLPAGELEALAYRVIYAPLVGQARRAETPDAEHEDCSGPDHYDGDLEREHAEACTSLSEAQFARRGELLALASQIPGAETEVRVAQSYTYCDCPHGEPGQPYLRVRLAWAGRQLSRCYGLGPVEAEIPEL
jgi:hypothetical protein